MLGFHFVNRNKDQTLSPLNSIDSDNNMNNDNFNDSSSNSNNDNRNNSNDYSLPRSSFSWKNKDWGILSRDTTETYFLGMIDVLQAYNFKKKMERWFKTNFKTVDKVRTPQHYYLFRGPHLQNNSHFSWLFFFVCFFDFFLKFFVFFCCRMVCLFNLRLCTVRGSLQKCKIF